jgi:hypothetical protein
MDTSVTVLIPLYRDVDAQCDAFDLAYEGIL